MARTMKNIALVAAASAMSFLGNMGCPETWVELKSSDKDGKQCVFTADAVTGDADAVKTFKTGSATSKTWDECKELCTGAAEKASTKDAPRYCIAASLLDVKDVKVKAEKGKDGDKDKDADKDKDKKAEEKTEKRGSCTHVIAGRGLKVEKEKWANAEGSELKDGNHCAAHTPGLESAGQGAKAKDAKKPREGEDPNKGKSFVGSSALRSIQPHTVSE